MKALPATSSSRAVSPTDRSFSYSEFRSPIQLRERFRYWWEHYSIEIIFGLVTSLILHISLMLILAAYLIPPTLGLHQTLPDTDLLGTVIETSALEIDIEENAKEETVFELEQDTGRSTDSPLEKEDRSLLLADLDQVSGFEVEPLSPLNMIPVRTGKPAAGKQNGNGVGNGVGNGTGTGTGNQEGTGAGTAKGKGVGFFGIEEKAESYVFIVDCSGSMSGARIARAKQELNNVLSQLDASQRYLVIFYNHNTYPLNGRSKRLALLPASRTHLGFTRYQIAQVRSFGGTLPQTAVTMALSLKPEVIFLLTDGEIPPITQQVALQQNKSQTIIHTLAFQSRLGELILKTIANDHNGRYRYIP